MNVYKLKVNHIESQLLLFNILSLENSYVRDNSEGKTDERGTFHFSK